jgi:hypothetical protein
VHVQECLDGQATSAATNSVCEELDLANRAMDRETRLDWRRDKATSAATNSVCEELDLANRAMDKETRLDWRRDQALGSYWGRALFESRPIY